MRRHPLQIRPNRRLVPFRLHALVAILYLIPPLGVSGADLPEPRIPVVLKVDDLSSKPDGSVSARWKRIIDFALERKIKLSIGIIANSLEGDKPAYLAYLKQLQESGLIELWFHGYDHSVHKDGGKTYAEFANRPYEEQKRRFELSQKLASEKLGAVFETFGQPGGGDTPATDNDLNVLARVVNETPGIKIWLYPMAFDARSAGLEAAGNVTVLDRVAPVNIEMPLFVPNAVKFIEGYSKYTKGRRYFILQGHPDMWDDARWEEFVKLVDYLQENHIPIVTPSELVATLPTKAPAEVSAPARPPFPPPNGANDLVFQSDFEGTTRVVPLSGQSDDIVGGSPNLEKSDWETLQTTGGIKNVWLNYTGGDMSKRGVKVGPDPVKPGNKVLQFWLKDSWAASEKQVKARVQLEFHAIEPGLKEFRQSVRMFFTDDFNALKTYPHPINWCTISEFWNNAWWTPAEKYGFRITLGIGKPTAEARELNFILNGESAGFKEVWNADNPSVKVPIGKWFTMEYYFREGNKDTGRFYMTITPEGEPRQVVFDVHDFTHMPDDPAPDGVTDYNPLKLYTSKQVMAYVKSQGKVLQIYWDDLKLWRAPRSL